MDVLIGFAGPAGSGKDTAADYLCDAYFMLRLAFADPIYRAVAAMLDTGVDDVKAHKDMVLPDLGVSPRALLQVLGTEGGRSLDPDLWVRFAERDAKAMKDRALGRAHLVVTDVRFENEADWIRGSGGLLVHISRPGRDPVREHVSERGILFADGDGLVDNDRDLAHLYRQLDRLVLAQFPMLAASRCG